MLPVEILPCQREISTEMAGGGIGGAFSAELAALPGFGVIQSGAGVSGFDVL